MTDGAARLLAHERDAYIGSVFRTSSLADVVDERDVAREELERALRRAATGGALRLALVGADPLDPRWTWLPGAVERLRLYADVDVDPGAVRDAAQVLEEMYVAIRDVMGGGRELHEAQGGKDAGLDRLLRVYGVEECDEFGDPLALRGCLSCCGGDGSCTICADFGSLLAVALEALVPTPGPLVCARCGHPEGEHLWEKGFEWREDDSAMAVKLRRLGYQVPRGAVRHFSRCASTCVHLGGDGRARPTPEGEDEGMAIGELVERGGVFEATWSPVALRRLGERNDLRREALAILCARCTPDDAL